MGTVGEVTVLIKFSPKRETMLGSINENIAFSSDGDDDDDFEQATSLSKQFVNSSCKCLQQGMQKCLQVAIQEI